MCMMTMVMIFFKALVLISLTLQLLLLPSSSIDNLTVNKTIKDGEYLVSARQRFELGFFSAGNSKLRYVGIWFYRVSIPPIVVWVANKDHPINDTSGVLSLNVEGNLELHQRHSNLPIWSTNLSTTLAFNNRSSTVVAQLLDDGNFILVHQNSENKGFVAWQSFDLPTNNRVPNFNIGLDRKTGVRRYLQSWKADDDPRAGTCTFQLDAGPSPQLFLYKQGIKRWRIGPWNGEAFNGMAKIQSEYFNFSYVDNSEEISTTFQVLKSDLIARMSLDESGFFNLYGWLPNLHTWLKVWSAPGGYCENYGVCGANSVCDSSKPEHYCSCLPGFEPMQPNDRKMANETSAGCIRSKPGSSLCSDKDSFTKLENVKLPDTSTAHVATDLKLEDCHQLCLKNCSCTAYASADVRDGGSRCLTWYGNLSDIATLNFRSQDLYLREAEGKSTSAQRRTLAIVTSVAVSIAILMGACFVYWIRRRKMKARWREEDTLHQETGEDGETHPILPFYNLKTIIESTEKFSCENKLGQGGFGAVYKGRLPNGQEIAVKRLSTTSGQGATEFKNEALLIAKLQHKNLVRLLGYCIHKEEKMLIYEYLPNKSLDFFIFDATQRYLLDWCMRFEIIIGIARGMLYLHQDSRLKVIHRDLKASNVLLDAAMKPKISDFGMARTSQEDQFPANTKRIVGTYGYMAPEYAMGGHYSTKSDVFSFGVLLLEIICGRRNTEFENGSASFNLIGQVWDMWRGGNALDIADSTLLLAASSNGANFDEILKSIQIGLLCVQEDPGLRPTMLTVVFMLSNETTLPPPSKPAFIFRIRNPDESDSSTSGAATVLNDMTMSSIFSGR